MPKGIYVIFDRHGATEPECVWVGPFGGLSFNSDGVLVDRNEDVVALPDLESPGWWIPECGDTGASYRMRLSTSHKKEKKHG